MSQTTIFYFSGTGNSLAISKAIAEKLGDTDVIPMVQSNALEKVNNSERIGLVFPVYVFGLPLVVTRFVKSLRISKRIYLFAVAVHGGMPCGTLKQASSLFSQNGISLSAGFEIMMVDNYIPISGAIALEKQQKRFEKAKIKIEDICSAIKQGDRSIYSGWPLVNWIFNRMYKGWEPKAASLDSNFMADSNCNACGVCEKICPVGNITMNDSTPEWKHHCEQCFACLHWCPQKAIQYGKRTSGRTRYHHPDIKMPEMIIREN
jgi:ferredoxin